MSADMTRAERSAVIPSDGDGRPPGDPCMRWLASDEARDHDGHWVALDPYTGQFLGRADTREDLRRWRLRDLSLVFVASQEAM